MITEYLIEIIASITILTISIIYFIIKKSKIEKENNFDEFTIKEEIIQDKYDMQENITEFTLTESEPIIMQDIQESIDMGYDEPKYTKPAKEIKKASIMKRTIPSHGKISKKNFKEFAGKRILVAEDNLINQKVIAGLLAGSGIELVMANNGKEALDILKDDQNFTIILMDAHMPIMDGFIATELIRENEKYNHIVVVALSGDTAPDDIKKMSKAGMQEHLEKPLRIDAFYDILYAYTGAQKVSIEEHITKELNADKGLDMCQGDKEFYLEILQEFVKAYQDSSDKLYTLMKRKDIIETDKLLLDIIGITAAIGAESLEEISKNLKEAIRDTEENSYITILEQYSKHLQALLINIKEYN